MAMVEKSVLIERSAQQMFDLVENIEDYPRFLPWCSRTHVEFRDQSKTVATLHINYHGIKSHFSTENEKHYPSHMLIRLTDGPFTHLDGSWNFIPLGDAACKVEFNLHYEFSSRLIEKAVGPVFNHIANTFVDSFVKRAGQVYGGKA